MKSLIRAYWDMLLPRLPDDKFILNDQKVRKIVKEVARGNTSLQIGKYSTLSKRKAQKEQIGKHSFV